MDLRLWTPNWTESHILRSYGIFQNPTTEPCLVRSTKGYPEAAKSARP